MSVVSGTPAGGQDEPDIPIEPEDSTTLMKVLASVYNTEERTFTLLRVVHYPRELIPAWPGTALGFWSIIFEDLDRGVMSGAYRDLLRAAYETYSANPRIAALHSRYLGQPEQQPTSSPSSPDSVPAAGSTQAQDQPTPSPQQPTDTCHLVVWLDSAEQRDALIEWLAGHGITAEAEWSTPSTASYRLNQADPQEVDRIMLSRRDFGWQVLAPGAPDYVLRYLSVEGPDGRRFRFNDVPSATPVRNVGDELVGQYTEGLPGAEQATVIEHVGPEGPRRMNPDSTVGEEGITEGSRLRVGFERRAAAVNPLDRRNALLRVRSQIDEYQDATPGFQYVPNSPALPTEYDIEFTRPSFGPPAVRGEEPTDISVHQVSIVLPPDFPIAAPRVRWLTDIFHPNVYPTYESERTRENPHARGIVCLGTLAESYVPSLDFGELCATLADIAGFRNYSVFVPADNQVDAATGQPVLKGDFYDGDAARWTISPRGQERIAGIGGATAQRDLRAERGTLSFEIDDVSDLDGDDLDLSEPGA